MKKELLKIVTSKLFFVWIIISFFVIFLYFSNYNSKKSTDHMSYYSIYESSSKEELIQKRDEVIYERDHLDTTSEHYKALYKYDTEKIALYDLIIEKGCSSTEVYENGQLYMDGDGLVFLIHAKEIIVYLGIISIVLLFYISFTYSFDVGIYQYIFYEDRKRRAINRFLSVFIVLVFYVIFISLISLIFSYILDNDYNYVALCANKNMYLLNKHTFLIYYWFVHILYIVLFSFSISCSVLLFTRKTLIFAISFITIIAVLFVGIYFSGIDNLLSMNNYVSHLDYSLTYFNIYPIYLLIPFVFMIFSLRHFEKIDL